MIVKQFVYIFFIYGWSSCICHTNAKNSTTLATVLLSNGTRNSSVKADNISSVALTNETSSEDYLYAHCLVKPQSSEAAAIDGQSVRGSVMFRQLLVGGPTEIRINLTGFATGDSQKTHGLHVHEFGDMSQGCNSLGYHFNPLGVTHGAPNDSPDFRHFGDLGNVVETAGGEVHSTLTDYLLSLLGPFSILGRSVVVHTLEDDLGRGKADTSLDTGNAGGRLACCTIGLSEGTSWKY